jgi:alkylation response protein AidB-like acyl-CoA dehydrogenase
MDAGEGRSGAALGEELLARARALVPALRERGREAEEIRRIPQSTIRDFDTAGLFAIMTPVRFGGPDIPYGYVPRIIREIARGCLSTSWTLGLLIQHNFQIAMFPEAAQREAWADANYALAPGFFEPRGVAETVEGGFLVTGTWRYGSGIHHSPWVLLTGLETAPDGATVARRFLIPTADGEIVDEWHVAGMKSSGSCDFKIDRLFVPAHHSMPVSAMLDATAPGLALGHGPTWTLPMLIVWNVNMMGMGIGAAEGVWEMALEHNRVRAMPFRRTLAREDAHVRAHLGKARADIDAMDALFERILGRVDAMALGAAAMAADERARLRLHETYMFKKSNEVVNAIADMTGTATYALSHPIQRFRRDLNMLSGHGFHDYELVADTFIGALYGLDPPEGLLI